MTQAGVTVAEQTEAVARRRRLWLVLSVGGLVFLLAAPFFWAFGLDLMSYWRFDLEHPYRGIDALTGVGAFRYAPPIALLFYPLRFLPWEALQVLWLTLQLACLWYIGRRWALALVLFPPVWLDIVYGNVNLFIAAAAVAGLRYPLAWAFPLLTKVTPGVGVLWFLFRREWLNLAIAAFGTLLIFAGSVAVQGVTVWYEWFNALAAMNSMSTASHVPIPVLARLPLCVLLLAWGAIRDRKWTVPVAVTLAMPTLWPIAFAPLIGVSHRSRTRAQDDDEVRTQHPLARVGEVVRSIGRVGLNQERRLP